MSLGSSPSAGANGIRVGVVMGHDSSQGIGTLFCTLKGTHGSGFGSEFAQNENASNAT